MNAFEVGQKVVELFRAGKHEEIMNDLYSPNIVSVEADGMKHEGMEGLKAKYQWWAENFEEHGSTVEGPYPHGGDEFILTFTMDTTHKPSGHRSQMTEAAHYKVENGKIVHEKFFYVQEGE